jgi:CRP-like cAMP-binding protein
MSSKRHYLESVEVFKDLTPSEMEAVSQQTTLMHYSAGYLFYAPDDAGEALFILKQGRVQLYRMSPDGRKFIVATLAAGTIFGHMVLTGQRLHNTFAEAIDDCVICVWNREQVEQLLLEKPRVALRFLETMGQRLFLAEERLEEITFKRIPARMASLLLKLEREQGGRGVLLGYTHQYLADLLGTYRETVTQTLSEFRSQGLIKNGRKAIYLLDTNGLQSIADG